MFTALGMIICSLHRSKRVRGNFQGQLQQHTWTRSGQLLHLQFQTKVIGIARLVQISIRLGRIDELADELNCHWREGSRERRRAARWSLSQMKVRGAIQQKKIGLGFVLENGLRFCDLS